MHKLWEETSNRLEHLQIQIRNITMGGESGNIFQPLSNVTPSLGMSNEISFSLKPKVNEV